MFIIKSMRIPDVISHFRQIESFCHHLEVLTFPSIEVMSKPQKKKFEIPLWFG